jgi:hypothetical protein
MELDLDNVPGHEPTVLEYARLHGISKDYALEGPSLRCVLKIPDEDFKKDFYDPADSRLWNASLNELTRERLAVTRESALLLRSVHLLSETPDYSQLLPDKRKLVLGSKQEVSLLRHDNELDMLHFGSVETPRFDNLRIPLEPIDAENDEGLEWPSSYSAYPAQCYERAKVEKLEVPRDTLVYLQKTTKGHLVRHDVEKSITEELIHERVSASHDTVRRLTVSERTIATSHSATASSVTTNDTLHSIFTYELASTSFGRFKLYGC